MYGAALRGWSSYQEAQIGPYEAFVGGASKGHKKTHHHEKQTEDELTPVQETQLDQIATGDPDSNSWDDFMAAIMGGDDSDDLAERVAEAERERVLAELDDAQDKDETEDALEALIGGLEDAFKVEYDDVEALL